MNFISNLTKNGKTHSKKSTKAAKKAGKAGGRKKKGTESYSTYIYKVLKWLHPDTGIYISPSAACPS
jgi:histone H2B